MKYTRSLNVVASAAIVASSWGTGTVAGTLVGDVWTPGRDPAGVVNLASWNLVPLNRWVTVEGTRLDSLDAAVKAAIPGWRDYGVEGWSGVTNDWCGLTIDQAGSRAWLFGGGHAGSGNNGLYRFDLFRMLWAIENLPSDPAPWSNDYKTHGSFTECNESLAQYHARGGALQAINDWFYDELFWDRKPTARHTYSTMVYVPELNEIVMVCRRLWRYSLTQGQWVYKRFIRDQLDNSYMDGENGIATYDETAHEVLVSSAGSSGIYRATGYNMQSQQWTGWASPWNIYADAADCRHGRFMTVISPPKSAGGGYGANNSNYWKYNLDTRQVVANGAAQFSAGLSPANFVTSGSFYDSAALVFIPEHNKYWLLTKMSDGSTKYLWLDPSTTPWTIGPVVAFPNALPEPFVNPERKTIYFDALKAVAVVTGADCKLNIFRLG